MLLNMWGATKAIGGIVLHGRIGSPHAPLTPIGLPVSMRRFCRLSPDAILRHEQWDQVVYDLHVAVQSAAEIQAAPPAAATPTPAPTPAPAGRVRRLTAAERRALDNAELAKIMAEHRELPWHDPSVSKEHKLNKQFADRMPDLPGERHAGLKRKGQRLTEALERWRLQQN
jgi:hypothetical protein